MIISVDFDGTCVTHEFPKTGKNIGAEIVLKELSDCDHKIICTSMRSNEHSITINTDTIKGIKDWFSENDIKLYAINDNPSQDAWSKSRKIYANLYIDDQFLGCPLCYNKEYSDRVFVDWYTVTKMLSEMNVIDGENGIKIMSKLKEKYSEIYNF